MTDQTTSLPNGANLQADELSASLTVKNIHESVAWYCDVAGFSVGQKFEREGALQAVSLRAGSVRVLLTQDNGAKGLDRAKGEGFSLMITTKQDIDELASRIKATDWPLDTEPVTMPHGARAFRLRDPDGFRFTFSSM
jgi:uncharacterized glyoxalase superfamily protein PhnB